MVKEDVIYKRLRLFVFLLVIFALFWFSDSIYLFYDMNKLIFTIIGFTILMLFVAYLIFNQSFAKDIFKDSLKGIDTFDSFNTKDTKDAKWGEKEDTKTKRKPKAETKRSVSGYMKRMIAAKQGWNCGNCNRVLQAAFEVDHIISLSRGGSNEESNLIALCRDCHGEKTFRERTVTHHSLS